MSKYIDADRIRAEIERQIAFLPTVGYSTQVASEFIPVQNTLNYILSFIDSLQQEQPSLPSNLDEAASEFANKEFPNELAVGQWGTGDYEPPVDMEYPREIAKDAFKAGVLCMAKQHANDVAEATESAFNAGKEQEPLRELIEQLKKLM